MTPTENQLDNSPIGTPLSREDVAATMEEWARTNPPSRFMVYGITDDDPGNGGCDGDVIAWGLCFDDHVYVQSVDSHVGGRFRSPPPCAASSSTAIATSTGSGLTPNPKT